MPRRRAAFLLLTSTGLGCVLASTTGCSTASTGDPFSNSREDVRANSFVEASGAIVAGTFATIGNGIKELTGPKPTYYAGILADPAAPAEEQRKAINELVGYDYGRREPYTDAYAQIATENENELVRATALRAINRSRDTRQSAAVIKLLDDDSPLVRLEAAKTLASIPDAKAAAPLLRVSLDTDQPTDVRLAAVDALRHYESDSLARGLVRLLEDDEFSVAWQTRRTLVTLFNVDLGYDADAWNDHLQNAADAPEG